MPTAPILAPLDTTDLAGQALAAAADMGERTGAPLHLLTARASMPAYTGPGDVDAGYRTLVEVGVDRVLGPGACAALAPTIHVAHATPAASATLALAGELDPQLIVLGTHGRRGYQRFVQGSVAEEVIRKTRHPVLVVPMHAERRQPGPTQPVVVATDLSDFGAAALRAARAHAERFEAPVVVVHVVPPSVGPFLTIDLPLDDVGAPDAAFLAAKRQVAEAGLEGADLVVTRGAPAEVIDWVAAERGAGCIVMGTHGRGGLVRSLVGSVAESVLRSATCSVLVVRPASEADQN